MSQTDQTQAAKGERRTRPGRALAIMHAPGSGKSLVFIGSFRDGVTSAFDLYGVNFRPFARTLSKRKLYEGFHRDRQMLRHDFGKAYGTCLAQIKRVDRADIVSAVEEFAEHRTPV